MESNKDQHNTFTDGMESLKLYVSEVMEEKAAYNCKKLIQLLNTFASPLVSHLNDEIQTILELDNYSIDWKNYNKTLTRHAVKNADKVYLMLSLPLSSVKKLIASRRTEKFHLS